MSEEEFRNRVQEGLPDASIDPHFRFDLEFGFSTTKMIKQALIERYKLLAEAPATPHKDCIWFDIHRYRKSSLNGNYTVTTSYGIYRGTTLNGSYKWVEGKMVTPGVSVLFEGESEFQLRWALLTDITYDFLEAPFAFYHRKGYFPIYDCSIPGVDPDAVCKAISEYLAYKKIMNWAQANLS